MKISNSKRQLAKIISENGGWRDWVNFVAQDKDGEVFGFGEKPVLGASREVWAPAGHTGILCTSQTIRGWHQTILSRDEYFHLYPAPDADGWIEWKGGKCPVAEGTPISIRHRDGEEFANAFALGNWNSRWEHKGMEGDVVAYRLRKPEQAKPAQEPVAETKQTIEQLAADYRNVKDYADRKQQEADDAKADADAKLAELVAAGKALGLALGIACVEPELVITDWQDLRVGDVIECVGSWERENTDGLQLAVTSLEVPDYEGDLPIRVEVPGISCPGTWGGDFKFIRRPVKGTDNA